ncbi:hypothetical protein BOTBODRAFT_348398 [Botryobasidium botryosum FD-172 SS1]|uniref:Uncharacterized protein n=1 Tax=Botryobasidium botryosum (strain FD-172 SS1) TaxID=930990 RepID=A0A067MFH5_BOTB1|nr:hypothetical protein BOTBODRAFT_348398 [Botryobasidium botryosum FD-172 SS1]
MCLRHSHGSLLSFSVEYVNDRSQITLRSRRLGTQKLVAVASSSSPSFNFMSGDSDSLTVLSPSKSPARLPPSEIMWLNSTAIPVTHPEISQSQVTCQRRLRTRPARKQRSSVLQSSFLPVPAEPLPASPLALPGYSDD